MKSFFLSCCFFVLPFILNAQIDTIALSTIEGITNKMLEIISGPIGKERDWDEFRNLFTADANFGSKTMGADGRERIGSRHLEEFVRNVGPLYARDGFEEYTIGLQIQEFNGIASAFQSFYCKNLTGTYENRGVNSYQLIYSQNRWWISSVLFTNETEDTPLPNELLYKKYQK